MQLKKLLVQSIFWRGLYFITVLLLNVLVARFFEASGSGWIYYLSSVYAFVIVLISLSLDSGMGFFASRKEVAVNKLLSLSVCWTFISGVLVTIASMLYTGSAAALPANMLLVSSLSYICGNLLTNYCSVIFYSNKNFHTPNIIGIFCNLLLVVILSLRYLGFWASTNSNLFLYIYFLGFLVQGVMTLAAVVLSFNVKGLLVFVSKNEFRIILKYSLAAFMANIIFFLVYRVDYFFVKYYCSARELGNYIQVSKFCQMVMLLPSFMASAVFPMVAGGQKEEVNRGLKMLSRISLLVIGSFCMLVALTGGWLFPFVFGNSFDRMYLPFLLLVPGVLSLSSLYPLAAYYSGKNKLEVNITGSMLALLFIVIADFIFIPVYGIYAAALISSIGYILYHAYVLSRFSREYNTRVTGFFFIKKTDFTWMQQFVLKTLQSNEKQ
jgi:O-antigen/teichoic acid export membrane protein